MDIRKSVCRNNALANAFFDIKGKFLKEICVSFVSDSKQGVSSFQHKSVKLLPNKILGGVYGCRKLFTLERENTKLS